MVFPVPDRVRDTIFYVFRDVLHITTENYISLRNFMMRISICDLTNISIDIEAFWWGWWWWSQFNLRWRKKELGNDLLFHNNYFNSCLSS